MSDLAIPRVDPEDRPVHYGKHHRAPCGEWRPVKSNKACPYCEETCPECGSRYHRREG